MPEITPLLKLNGLHVLVTGATGFIGSHLAGRLLHEGCHVTLLVRNPEKLGSHLRGANIVIGDLSNTEALARAVAGVSVIFHCAANVSTWDSAEAYNAVNVTGVENLLTAVRHHNPSLSRFVHLSTVDVYGFPKAPCDETCEPRKSGFGYGDSKAAGEKLVREFCVRASIPYTIIRPCNVIGPDSQFITRIGVELRSGMMLMIDGGKANAGLVYIETLVDYLLWAATAHNATGQCYNVRDDVDVSWAEFLRKLRELLGGKGVIITLPFAVAEAASRLTEIFYRVFMPLKEPLLHPLLVRIFGRTCGHSAQKIRRDSAYRGNTCFDEAMERSAHWFLDEARK